MTYEAQKIILWRFARRMLVVGVAFLALSFFRPDAMSPNVYGIRAYSIPAEIWALGFISASGLIIYGLHINGRMPLLTPLLRLAGLAFLAIMYALLTVSAWSAPDGEVIVIFSVMFFLPDILAYARVESRQWLHRWRLARNVAR